MMKVQVTAFLVLVATLLISGNDGFCILSGCELSLAARLLGPMKTKFYLFTRESGDSRQTLYAKDVESAGRVFTNFRIRKTQVLVHGTLDKVDITGYFMEIKDELLKHGDYNVIVVDYFDGFFPPRSLLDYPREVGGQISDLIHELIRSTGITPDYFHIIGHSLGAHVAAEAAERVQGTGRLTGLDPGSPYEFMGRDDRMDDTDALFVDVIHTDMKTWGAIGIGVQKPAGHVDFYPNGGYSQPGCDKSLIKSALEFGPGKIVTEAAICSHMRSLRYFNESINSPCPFTSFPCANEEDFKSGKCNSCGSAGCGYMGFHADKNIPPEGENVIYFLTTNDKPPFCQG